MKRKAIGVLAIIAAAQACAASAGPPVALENVSAQDYAQQQSQKGVVLLVVNWDRKWNCGGFENAQILSMGFERVPDGGKADAAPSVLTLETPSRLFVNPVAVKYAFLIEPGLYALSAFDIKMAKSVSEVGHSRADHTKLFEDGKPLGGTFEVRAGEIVYIGHFFLDCAYQPMLWRYYLDGRTEFKGYLAKVKAAYPFLDTENAQFRLFKTTMFGEAYELPAQ